MALVALPETAKSGRSQFETPRNAKARRSMRMASAIERNPQVVDACIAASDAFARLCAYHGIAPALVDEKQVKGKMRIDSSGARIVVEVR